MDRLPPIHVESVAAQVNAWVNDVLPAEEQAKNFPMDPRIKASGVGRCRGDDEEEDKMCLLSLYAIFLFARVGDDSHLR